MAAMTYYCCEHRFYSCATRALCIPVAWIYCVNTSFLLYIICSKNDYLVSFIASVIVRMILLGKQVSASNKCFNATEGSQILNFNRKKS